jgi:endonuclease YncB( thermonuclease family)
MAALGFYGSLLMAAAALLRGETCTVSGVSDGDTIQVNCAGTTRTVRISSINAPESG